MIIIARKKPKEGVQSPRAARFRSAALSKSFQRRLSIKEEDARPTTTTESTKSAVKSFIIQMDKIAATKK